MIGAGMAYEDTHPLAFDGKDYARSFVVERIRELLNIQDMTVSDLASELGVSRERASEIVNHPQTATAEQVAALCGLFGCTPDYLRCEVDGYPDRTLELGGRDDMASLYDLLCESDKQAVWNHAKALLKLHDSGLYSAWAYGMGCSPAAL